MRTFLTLSALTFVALASGCASSVDTADAPTYGAAVRQMQESQTEPMTATNEAPEGSGAVGSLAQQRYRAGQVRELAAPSTSTTANSSH